MRGCIDTWCATQQSKGSRAVALKGVYRTRYILRRLAAFPQSKEPNIQSGVEPPHSKALRLIDAPRLVQRMVQQRRSQAGGTRQELNQSRVGFAHFPFSFSLF